jgi:hypothetical protein
LTISKLLPCLHPSSPPLSLLFLCRPPGFLTNPGGGGGGGSGGLGTGEGPALRGVLSSGSLDLSLKQEDKGVRDDGTEWHRGQFRGHTWKTNEVRRERGGREKGKGQGGRGEMCHGSIESMSLDIPPLLAHALTSPFLLALFSSVCALLDGVCAACGEYSLWGVRATSGQGTGQRRQGGLTYRYTRIEIYKK